MQRLGPGEETKKPGFVQPGRSGLFERGRKKVFCGGGREFQANNAGPGGVAEAGDGGDRGERKTLERERESEPVKSTTSQKEGERRKKKIKIKIILK